MHEAAPKWASTNSFSTRGAAAASSGFADGMALEITAEAFESAHRKKDADQCVTGKSLGSCGSVLGTRLLEVLPLRSQTTGRGSHKAIFPLPTSRAAFFQLNPLFE